MTQGRMEQAWSHTSHILATQMNCHRDPKRNPQPFIPRDVDLYYQSRKQQKKKKPTKEDFMALKALATKGV